MKNSEIKNLSVEELKSQIAADSKSLTTLKFSHAVSPIENPLSIRSLRRQIARLKTELTAKQSANRK